MAIDSPDIPLNSWTAWGHAQGPLLVIAEQEEPDQDGDAVAGVSAMANIVFNAKADKVNAILEALDAASCTITLTDGTEICAEISI